MERLVICKCFGFSGIIFTESVFQNSQNFQVAKALMNICKILSFQTFIAQTVVNTSVLNAMSFQFSKHANEANGSNLYLSITLSIYSQQCIIETCF